MNFAKSFPYHFKENEEEAFLEFFLIFSLVFFFLLIFSDGIHT